MRKTEGTVQQRYQKKQIIIEEEGSRLDAGCMERDKENWFRLDQLTRNQSYMNNDEI